MIRSRGTIFQSDHLVVIIMAGEYYVLKRNHENTADFIISILFIVFKGQVIRPSLALVMKVLYILNGIVFVILFDYCS